jgi:hypothetical protein
VLRIYPRADQRTVIAFVDCAAERLPFPIEVTPDRQRRRVPGPAFTGTCSTAASATSCIKPATPRLNGKVERSHRIDDTDMSNDRLREWEDDLQLRQTPRRPRRPDPL